MPIHTILVVYLGQIFLCKTIFIPTYSIDVVQCGWDGMVVGILLEWPLLSKGSFFCFFRLLACLSFRLLLSCPFLTIDPRVGVVFLTNCHSFYFTQGLLRILQLQIFASFPIELVYAPAFLLLDLVPERGIGDTPFIR